MLKAILLVTLVFVVLAVLFIAYMVWRVRTIVTSDERRTVTASVFCDDAARCLKVRMVLTGTHKPYTVKWISVRKSLVQSLGASPPIGFSDSSDLPGRNPDTVLWVGGFALRPGEPAVLTIPALTPSGGTGEISFCYEWSAKLMGGSMSFFTVSVANQENGTVS